MKILLIAGHGDGDPGACACGCKEAELTREVVANIKPMLSEYADATVYDTAKNMYKHLSDGEMFNFKQFDYVLEIHFNACVKDTKGNGVTTGTEVYVHPSEKGISVEECILDNITALGFKNRGVKRRSNLLNMNVCKGRQGVSYALLETCFIDDKDDIVLYQKKKSAVAEAIVKGIVKGFNLGKSDNKEGVKMPKTVYSINDVHVQVLDGWNFAIEQVDEKKQNINKANYVNAGFFGVAKSGTVPVGNLVIEGKVITDAKTQANWLNTARHKLTTFVLHNDNSLEFVQTDDMSAVKDVAYAISGIPIIRNGYKVSMDKIKEEGYFGNECYDTWHGFLGIRHGCIVYVAAKIEFEYMPYLMEVLGIKDAIKLDGGGSFIMHNGYFEKATTENRRINNIITWK